MISRIQNIPWWILIVGSLTLGLAPFQPMPHLIEKLTMLFNGTLREPVDIFDLFMHGTFPLLLIIKLFLTGIRGSE